MRILSIGYINPETGSFIPLSNNLSEPLPHYPLMAVEFDIKNVGTKTALPGWQFTAQLPTNPSYTYTSGPEQALTPGSGIIFTLRWSNPQSNNCYQPQIYPYQNYCQPQPYLYNQRAVTIAADPNHIVPDENWINNVASAAF